MMDNNRMYLSCLRWLIVDEADTFNDCQSLGSIFTRIVSPVLKKSRQAKIELNQGKDIFPKTIFVSTTNPPSLSKFLEQNLRDYKLIQDDQTHHNLQNIKHQFHHCNELDKHQPLLKILKLNKQRKALVFCNSVKSLHDLEYYLNSCAMQTLTLHSHLSKEMRLRNYQHFRDNVQKLMLTTDLGSRGLDFPDLQLVINYDFPEQLSDYLHRVGRTGRAGKSGQAITLYHNKNLPMIEQLRGCSFNQPLKVSNSAYGLKNRTLKPMQSKLKMRKIKK